MRKMCRLTLEIDLATLDDLTPIAKAAKAAGFNAVLESDSGDRDHDPEWWRLRIEGQGFADTVLQHAMDLGD